MSNRLPINRHVAHMSAVLFTMLALTGCGAEVAAGAATVGALQATQVKQAQAQRAQVVDGLKAAQEAGAARAQRAAD
jgi:hypothetical protein